MQHTLTQENYYQDKTYLSSSALSNYVKFDNYGNPIYSYQDFANPPSLEDNDNVMIGKILDELLTEWVVFEDKYEVVARRTGKSDKIEITNSMYEAIMKAMDAILKAPYTKDLTFWEFISQPSVSTQSILVDEDLKFKGKFDFLINNDSIIDLKCTGSVAMCKKELLWNGHLNLNHKWVRQMSIYRQLLLSSSRWEATASVNLAIVWHDGSCWFLNLDSKSLDLAYQNVLRDIKHLRHTIESGNYIESYTHYVKEDNEEQKVNTEVYTF